MLDLVLRKGATALLLGAGASKDCGVPTAQEFATAIREHLSALPPSDAGPLKEELDKILRKLPKNRQDVESLYQLIDDALDAHFYGSFVPAPALQASRALERLHYEIKKCIQARCFIGKEARITHLDYLVPLVTAERPLWIVSLNYDNAIELWAKRNHLRLCDPVVADGFAGEPPDVVLLKLHGSLTWYLDRSGKLASFRPFSVDAIRAIGEMRTATLETPLIYPSRRKLPIHAPFLENAVRFQRLLGSASHLVVIGCRFVDDHIRLWLLDGLRRNPRLSVTIVNPNAEEVIHTLVCDDLTTPVIDRIFVAAGSGHFKEVLEVGLQEAIAKRRPARQILSGGDLRAVVKELASAAALEPCTLGLPHRMPIPGKVHGLAASPDGNRLFITIGGANRGIKEYDLDSRTLRTILRDAGEARGLALAPRTHRLYFLDNRLFRPLRLPTTGLGRLRYVDLGSGRVYNVTGPSFRDLLGFARAVRRQGWRASLRAELVNVLSWPTDLLVDDDERVVLATQARELSIVNVHEGSVRSAAVPKLCFNLHALARVNDNTVIGVEEGVSQVTGWGRIIEFQQKAKTWGWKLRPGGYPRLFGVAYNSNRQLVLVTQCLAWPHGKILAFCYPSFKFVGTVSGLDFPEKILTHPSWDFVIFSDRNGLSQLPDEFLPVGR